MKKLLTILLLAYGALQAQPISPTLHTTLSKPTVVSISGGGPLDAVSQFYDAANFKYRDYRDTAEVLSYLNATKWRAGKHTIFVHSGGTLNGDATYTGGQTVEYWFRDGVADSNLVQKSYAESLLSTRDFYQNGDTVFAVNTLDTSYMQDDTTEVHVYRNSTVTKRVGNVTNVQLEETVAAQTFDSTHIYAALRDTAALKLNLSGTRSGYPVTGDIRTSTGATVNIGAVDSVNGSNYIEVDGSASIGIFRKVGDSSRVGLLLYDANDLIVENSPYSYGLKGQYYFGANYDNNAYVQKRYVVYLDSLNRAYTDSLVAAGGGSTTTSLPADSVTYDPTGNTIITGNNAQTALDQADAGIVAETARATAAEALKLNKTNFIDSLNSRLYRDSVVMVYPNERIQSKLNQVPAYGTLRFAPGYFYVAPDTLNSVMAVTRSNITIDIPAGTYIKIRDSSNARIDSVEINRNYAAQVGLSDISAQSTVSPPVDSLTFVITITSVGSPNQFSWQLNGGSTTSGVAMTGGFQTLSNNIQVKFNATTGHTLGDKWYLITSSTPASIIRIGQGFQADSILNTTIMGEGVLDGNLHKQYKINLNAAESGYTIGVFGRVNNTIIKDVSIINSERSVFASGRHSGTFNTDGTTTGGTAYNINNIRILGIKSYNNVAGILLGHPSYRGYTYNAIVSGCNLSGTGTIVEPNHRLYNFTISNNVIVSSASGYSVYMWRSPELGNIFNNVLVGATGDNAPTGWYRSGSVDVNSQFGYDFLTRPFRIEKSFANTTGEGIEFTYSAGSGVGSILAYNRTTSAYKALNVNGSTLNLNSAASTGNTTLNLLAGNTVIGSPTVVNGDGKFHAAGTAFPIGTFERTGSVSSGVNGVLAVKATAASAMSDGFGGSIVFRNRDDNAVDNNVVQLQAARNGADNSGDFIVATSNAGTSTQRFWVTKDGNTGANVAAPTSSLHTTSFATGYVAKTANYTATISDHTIDCTTGSFTITLPTAVGITGRIYVIKNTGAGTISIATTSSQTIDNTTPPTIAAGALLRVQSTGANWIIL